MRVGKDNAQEKREGVIKSENHNSVRTGDAVREGNTPRINSTSL